MPMKKVGKDDYVSSRHFNKAQVQKYYAGGLKEMPHEKNMSKGKATVCRGMGKADRGGKFGRNG